MNQTRKIVDIGFLLEIDYSQSPPSSKLCRLVPPPLQTVSGKIYGSPRLLLTLLLLDWLVLWGKILTMDNHRR